MIGVFFAVTAVLLKNDFVFIFKFIFTRNIVTMSANSADKAELDGNVFLCHYGLL